MSRCKRCNGDGRIRDNQPRSGGYLLHKATCPECAGKGRIGPAVHLFGIIQEASESDPETYGVLACGREYADPKTTTDPRFVTCKHCLAWMMAPKPQEEP